MIDYNLNLPTDLPDSEPQSLPCQDKIIFASQEQAAAAASADAYWHGGKLQVYQCRYCAMWHLTRLT